MDMQVIKCPDCGANLDYDGISPVVKCQYCGTEIAMNNPQAQAPQTVHYVDDTRMQRLEYRQQRHEERVARHEKHHEEREERRAERRARRGFI